MNPQKPMLNLAVKTWMIVFVLGLVACGGTRQPAPSAEEDEYVWPLPPDPPRIRYVKSIHSELDVGRKRSLAQRIFEAVFGRPPLRALKKPLAVHVDQSGRLLVSDTGWRRILVFDFDNNSLEPLGTKGKGRLINPLGVTTDDAGRIYVTDAGGSRVMVYDSTGKYLKALGGKDLLVRPFGIVVNSPLDRVYVVDTWAHQLKVFDRRSGGLLFAVGKNEQPPDQLIEGVLDQSWNRGDGDGEFRFPTQIAIGPEGQLYIVDTLNFRVQVLSPDGEFLTKFGQIGNLPGNLYRPKGIGLDSEGHVYVSDASFSNVQIFDQQGRLLLNFGTFGSGLSDLRLPAGLYVDQQDQIYVVDQFNNRVQVYQYLGGEPEADNQPLTEEERR